MIMINPDGVSDFPNPRFKIIRGVQMGLSIVTLAVTICSSVFGIWMMLVFNLPAVALATLWVIVTFSVYVSGHLGQALLQTIMDCIIGTTALIMSLLASVFFSFAEDVGPGGYSLGIIALILNYILAISFFATFGLGVVVHRKQVTLKRQGLLGYGRDGFLHNILDLPDHKAHVVITKIDSYQTA